MHSAVVDELAVKESPSAFVVLTVHRPRQRRTGYRRACGTAVHRRPAGCNELLRRFAQRVQRNASVEQLVGLNGSNVPSISEQGQPSGDVEIIAYPLLSLGTAPSAQEDRALRASLICRRGWPQPWDNGKLSTLYFRSYKQDIKSRELTLDDLPTS